MDTAEMISPYQRSVLQTPMTPFLVKLSKVVQGGISSCCCRGSGPERAIKSEQPKVTSPTLPRKIRRLLAKFDQLSRSAEI